MIVAAASHEFIPVAVYNNVPGRDAEILKKFKEPTWNNPVIRFLGADETDLIPRKGEIFHGGIVLRRMADALEQAKKPVPTYLKLAIAEFAPKSPEVAVFAMHCYWEGEAKLGSLDGVISTRIGMLDGSEVVEVIYDAAVLEFKQLLLKAKELECTHKVFARSDEHLKIATGIVGSKAVRSEKQINAKTQQQYHLAHFPRYHYLPLTAAQATKVNAAIASNKSPEEYLSPLQRDIYKRFTQTTDSQAKRLAAIVPDRSPVGVISYWVAVEEILAKQ